MNNDIRNTEKAVWGPQYSPRPLYWPRPIGRRSVWWPRGVLWPEYCLWGVSYFYYPTIFISVQSLCNILIYIIDKREVLQQEYSKPPILPSPHFRWVVTISISFFPGHISSNWFHRQAFEWLSVFLRRGQILCQRGSSCCHLYIIYSRNYFI